MGEIAPKDPNISEMNQAANVSHPEPATPPGVQSKLPPVTEKVSNHVKNIDIRASIVSALTSLMGRVKSLSELAKSISNFVNKHLNPEKAKTPMPKTLHEVDAQLAELDIEIATKTKQHESLKNPSTQEDYNPTIGKALQKQLSEAQNERQELLKTREKFIKQSACPTQLRECFAKIDAHKQAMIAAGDSSKVGDWVKKQHEKIDSQLASMESLGKVYDELLEGIENDMEGVVEEMSNRKLYSDSPLVADDEAPLNRLTNAHLANKLDRRENELKEAIQEKENAPLEHKEVYDELINDLKQQIQDMHKEIEGRDDRISPSNMSDAHLIDLMSRRKKDHMEAIKDKKEALAPMAQAMLDSIG